MMLAYVDVHVSSSQAPYSTTPRSPTGVRRLPRTPASISATSSPTHSLAMPEPEPYHEQALPPLPSPQRLNYPPFDLYTPSSSSRAATSSLNNRRLPQAPNGTSTLPDGAKPPIPPLPYDHRPSTQGSNDFSIGPITDDGYPTSLNRLPSYRPPGALPPTIPGRSSGEQQSSSYDIYSGDFRPHSNVNGYYKPVDTRQFQLPMLPASSSPPDIPVALPRPSSQEYLTNPLESVHSSISYSSFPTAPDTTLQCLYLILMHRYPIQLIIDMQMVVITTQSCNGIHPFLPG